MQAHTTQTPTDAPTQTYTTLSATAVPDLQEGDTLRVTYESAYGGTQVIEGTVEQVRITLSPAEDDYLCSTIYLSTDEGARKVNLDAVPGGSPNGDVHTKRQGHDASTAAGETQYRSGSWSRVSAQATTLTVAVPCEDADEDADTAEAEAEPEPRRLMTDGGQAQGTDEFIFQQYDPEAEAEPEPVSLTFTVVDSWQNSYGDQKAAVTAPAPWEVPDDAPVSHTPNEVVKSLAWDDYHYTFDRDREAWVLDIEGLKPLAERAEDTGYEWAGRARSEVTDEEDEALQTLRALCDRAVPGDHISVTYRMKNGNGTNVYEGTVDSAQVAPDTEPTDDRDRRRSRSRSRARTTGIVFTDESGKTKRVKLDDEETPALFSAGYHPFMGGLISVTLSDAPAE
jgi:hypothetical protein